MRIFFALWFRDVLKLVREPSRWFGIVSQPLLFWIVLGTGLGGQFKSNYLQYFFPGILLMVILFSCIFSSMTMIEDRQSGFLKSVLPLTKRRFSILFGKMFGITTIVFVQILCLVPLMPLADVSFLHMNWIAFLATIVLGSFILSSLNLSFAWVLHSTHAYHGLMSVVLIPFWMMSGAMFPLDKTWMSCFTYFNPMSFIYEGLSFSMSGGTNGGIIFFKLIVCCVIFILISVGIISKPSRQEG